MPKKRYLIIGAVLALILIFVQMGSLSKRTIAATNNNTKRIGLSLDCSRTYYAPSTIKKYIDLLKKDHGTYLQLHLNDNERYGVESSTLGQTVKNSYEKNGIYYNKKTKRAFLTKDQLLDIIQYGYMNGIEVIPEIDLPGHDQSIIKLLSYTSAGKKLAKQLDNKDGYNEMYYHKKATLDFSKKLLSEYVGLLPKGYHIIIGADEITINNRSDQNAAVKYINAIDDYVKQHNLKLEMWNDSFHKAVLNKYHKDILINYWSLTGEVSSSKDRKDNVRMRATLPELNKAGFKTINYNNYYLYMITDPTSFTKESKKIWTSEFKKWKMSMWNDQSKKNLAKSKNNIGAAFSIWGEYPNQYTGEQTYQKTYYYADAFLKAKKQFKK
ncbi:hypothetical protein AKUH3B110M_08730 [Apilactobacillus kunkeei]|uniref:family 20 glycosylhydrolase n=1 Tax=Apilactobacillus kunkeei TaxID=148814 RepID=UPI00200A43BA|nr:family 20 glycosylhydrolase [Apilactobacillus kunkeei]MCK8634545.1 family 20 glycosylhydrolase [Apilactobacillus kunkeei]CAI2609472.1 hypothetical protein AKUG0804_08750 [Apilactobacillus kunkeei]CAI2610040.1 hypothetical protein AKUH3B207X_08730 [Apilactobacillus kunkeei]CAI2610619.1 hypothetical protein AKUG0802_08730 [Apilactobacillus kunkeei]CAI2610686.1 hypothetical protein AKUG0401_08750 [Apilactobacillus kunkeei]